MAQDNQLEFPPRPAAQADTRPDALADLTRREDKDALFASIAEHTRELNGLFDEEKYDVQGGNYLQKKSYLYQMKDSREVGRRVETRVRVRAINKELEGALRAAQRQSLEDERGRLLAELEDNPLILSKKTEEKLAEGKRNKLRTNWVTTVLGRIDNIISDFSFKKLGQGCGFDELYPEIEQKQAWWKQLVIAEKNIEKQLNDLNDAGVTGQEALAIEFREALAANRRAKIEFVSVELKQLQQRALHLMRDLRHRLLGERLEV